MSQKTKQEKEKGEYIRRNRKGHRLITNLFEKMSAEYGEFPDENMIIGEILKIQDDEFDSLLLTGDCLDR